MGIPQKAELNGLEEFIPPATDLGPPGLLVVQQLWAGQKNSKMHAKKILTANGFLFLVAFLFVIRDGYSSQSPRIESNGGKSQTLTVQRAQMVEQQLKGRDIVNEKVLTVMNTVERHRFVPKNLQAHAYADSPLPIGYGQTISQPYIVALMTQTLQLDEDDRILEIGTGSGYQAAVLAELKHEVYTIEIIDELAESAKARLQNLGYDNVRVKHADGYFGWKEYAPFDAIIVTAAANHIPPPLLQQLKDGGKLIIPLSSTLRFQTLTLVSRKDGEVETEFITSVRFVPLTGKTLQR